MVRFLAAGWAFASLAIYGCSGRPTSGGEGPQCVSDLEPGDLVFTEVMANPKGDDKGREWFEVFNASGRDVDAEGVVVKLSKPDGSSESRLVLPSILIKAGEYLVFGRAMPVAATEWMDYPYATGLGNLQQSSGGRLSILCADTVVDEVLFPPVTEESHSWSLDGTEPPNAERNDDPKMWCAAQTKYDSENHGSPGQPNEPCASVIPAGSCWDGTQVRPLRLPKVGDLVLSEFHAKPGAVDYRKGEWLEIAVLANVDLNGLQAGKDKADLKNLISFANCIEGQEGTYLVFVRNVDPTVNGGIEGAAGLLPFGLSDEGSNDLFIAVEGEVLDQVTYSSSWVKKGAAIGLDPRHMDPAKNDVLGNWCFATDPYGLGDLGTPGQPNPQCK